MRSVISEMFVDLISNAQSVMFDAERGDLFYLFTSVDFAERIVGCVDHDNLGFVGERFLELFLIPGPVR